jgi:hypothetical protein
MSALFTLPDTTLSVYVLAEVIASVLADVIAFVLSDLNVLNSDLSNLLDTLEST